MTKYDQDKLIRQFWEALHKANARLLEDRDNFYGYFLMQMGREIRWDLEMPTAVNFKQARYFIYFNPLLFLQLTPKEMENTLKHEILHILSLHLIRSKSLSRDYSKKARNLAMDLVVNVYLEPLPRGSVTIADVNRTFSLQLKLFETFEFYAAHIQKALDSDETIDETAFEDMAIIHDIWDEGDDMDETTLLAFTEKAISQSVKGELSENLMGLLDLIGNQKNELPWNLYLKRLMGTVESDKKKTTMRRNRRQPERLDIRGQLRSHKAKIMVAIDTSGSISDAEFEQAMVEVMHLVKNYPHELTVVECDSSILQSYTVHRITDLKERIKNKGSTLFSPVIAFANQTRINLLIYFTDGLGETHLTVQPQGYKILWVLSSQGEKLSLERAWGTVKKLEGGLSESQHHDFYVEKGGYSMNHQERV